MRRNQTGGTELIPMPCPTEAAQLSLPIILYSALEASCGELGRISTCQSRRSRERVGTSYNACKNEINIYLEILMYGMKYVFYCIYIHISGICGVHGNVGA